MLGIDEGCQPAQGLDAGNRVQGNGGFSGGLRAVHLDDPTAWQTADSQRDVEGDGSGRDHLNRSTAFVSESHDGALAELLFDL